MSINTPDEFEAAVKMLIVTAKDVVDNADAGYAKGLTVISSVNLQDIEDLRKAVDVLYPLLQGE